MNKQEADEYFGELLLDAEVKADYLPFKACWICAASIPEPFSGHIYYVIYSSEEPREFDFNVFRKPVFDEIRFKRRLEKSKVRYSK